jgi:tetratricopeptide (TPR) repeat protein
LRSTRTFLYGLLFFLITVLPVVNLVPVGLGIAADRYTYVPYIGLFYIFAAIIAWLYRHIAAHEKAAFGILTTALCILCVGLSFASWQRARVWRSDFTLYSDIINNYKNVPIAYNNRGFAYICKGDYDRALADCSEAVRLDPRYFDALNNLGNIYQFKQDYAAAERYFNKAKEVKPSDTVYIGLGNLYKHEGDNNRALVQYRMALAMNVKCDRAYYSIGMIKQTQGDIDGAVKEYTAALNVNPYNDQAYAARGDIAMNRGDYRAAIADYTRIIGYKTYPKVYQSRGLAYMKTGAYHEAVADFSRAIEMKKNYAEAYFSRGTVLGLAGRYDLALDDYNKALAANDRFGEAYASRAVAYFYKKNYARSQQDVRRAQALGYNVDRDFLAQLEQYAHLQKQ